MSSTAARRRLIRSIINDRSVSSQADLVALLANSGVKVTQATVSRDLAEIGATKRQDGRYQLGEVTEAADAVLIKAFEEFVESISSSGTLVVIKTPPGAAQVVAAAIDGAGIDGVIGTVAGDDTIIVVASEQATGRGVKHKLEKIGDKQ